MPSILTAPRASFTSSNLKGLMMASIFFIIFQELFSVEREVACSPTRHCSYSATHKRKNLVRAGGGREQTWNSRICRPRKSSGYPDERNSCAVVVRVIPLKHR